MLDFVTDTLGDLFIGAIVGAALWGIGCAQVWHYFFTGSSRDHWSIKCMVIGAWLLDTLSQLIAGWMVYDYAVTNFGNYFYLIQLAPSYQMATVHTVVVMVTTVIVQSFYVWRIWKLSIQKWLFTSPLVALLVAEIVMGSLQASYIAKSRTWLDVLNKSGKIPLSTFAVTFVTDTLIAILMCWILLTNRSEFTRTNSLIWRLVVLTLSTNTVTSLCAFGVVLSISVWPNKLLFVTFFEGIIRLEINSFLAALNMRPYLSGQDNSTSQPLSGRSLSLFASKLRARRNQARQPPEISISIDMNTLGSVQDPPAKEEPSKPRADVAFRTSQEG